MTLRWQVLLILSLCLCLNTPILADGLKGAQWHVQKNEQPKKRIERDAPINVSERSIAPDSLGALIRQSVASLNFRLDNIKSKIKGGEQLNKEEREFLTEVSRHQALSKYIDNELWELIRGRGERGEQWADAIITLSGKGIRPATIAKDQGKESRKTDAVLDESGVEVIEKNGKKRFASRYNGITQSVLAGYKGPDYSSQQENISYFSREGFNHEQAKTAVGSGSEAKKEYEEKIFGRKLVIDETSSNNIAFQHDIESNIRTSPVIQSNVRNSPLEQFNPDTMISKILDEVTAGMPKSERRDIEGSVATLLENADAAAAAREPAADEENDEAIRRKRRKDQDTNTDVTSPTGSAGAHY